MFRYAGSDVDAETVGVYVWECALFATFTPALFSEFAVAEELTLPVAL